MPFFCTRGAVLYTERVRLEKDALKNEFENDSIPVEDGKFWSFESLLLRKEGRIYDFMVFLISRLNRIPFNSFPARTAHRYSGKLMNYVWSQYNKYAPFQFQKNIELSRNGKLQMLGAHFETTLNSTNKHF